MMEFNMNMIAKSEKDFFIEMLPYVSEYIMDYRINADIVSIKVENESSKEIVLTQLQNLVTMVNSQFSINKNITPETKILFDNTGVTPGNSKSVFEELLEDGSIGRISNGIYSYDGLFLKIFTYFSRKIKHFAANTFKGLRHVKYPVLFSIDNFEKGGYFETFPHHIMFQTILKNNFDLIDRVAKKQITTSELLNHMKQPAHVLLNAACVPVYPMLSDSIIAKENLPLYYYVLNTCFRNEAENVFELARLNQFNMAEIVFIGLKDDMKKCIDKAKELWKFWIDIFNLNCKIETANDSFFAGNYKKLKYFQLIGKSKEEFKILLPHKNTYVACASANYHITHFTKRFNIKDNDGFLNSACFAFGLERLTYCFLSQYGLDVSKWDKGIVLELKKHIEL